MDLSMRLGDFPISGVGLLAWLSEPIISPQFT
jgi:hypothetical protein